MSYSFKVFLNAVKLSVSFLLPILHLEIVHYHHIYIFLFQNENGVVFVNGLQLILYVSQRSAWDQLPKIIILLKWKFLAECFLKIICKIFWLGQDS